MSKVLSCVIVTSTVFRSVDQWICMRQLNELNEQFLVSGVYNFLKYFIVPIVSLNFFSNWSNFPSLLSIQILLWLSFYQSSIKCRANFEHYSHQNTWTLRLCINWLIGELVPITWKSIKIQLRWLSANAFKLFQHDLMIYFCQISN